VILYINTKQPEKAMDKSLWQRISRDRERAIAKNPDGQLFDTKGRDMELLANLYITSLTPFCGVIDGVADITGNLQGDITKLLGALKENNGPQPRIGKQDGMQFYELSVPQSEQLPPMDVMFVPVGSNRIQFRISIAPRGRTAPQLLSASARTAPLIAGISGGEPAFAFAARTEKFSAAPLPENDNAREFGDFLKKTKTLCISGHVEGKLLLVSAVFEFKAAEDAAAFADKARSMVTQLLSAAGWKSAPQIVLKGDRLEIRLSVDIAAAWNIVSQISAGRRAAAPRKKAPQNND